MSKPTKPNDPLEAAKAGSIADPELEAAGMQLEVLEQAAQPVAAPPPPPPAAAVKRPAKPVVLARYRILADKLVSIGRHQTVVRAGTEFTVESYDPEALKAQGVQIEQIA